MSTGPINAGHGHGNITATGKGHHAKHYKSDKAEAANVAQIGKPFTPMTHNAPVQSLSVPHAVLGCDGCGAGTYHAPGHEVPACAHCGSGLDPANIRRHETP